MSIKNLNAKIRNCHKCRLSKTRINALCGEGNLNAKLFLIAQAPGVNEDREGKMFIGPSGKVLDELLEASNIDRNEIYMTNLVKCMLPKYRKPKKDEIETCGKYLDLEIEFINPKVLVPLGYFAIKYIFEKYKITLPSKQEFHKIFGKLLLADNRKILSLRHPASVLYDNKKKEELIKNYHKLKILSKNCKWHLTCPMKKYTDKGYLNPEWIELNCKGDWESCKRYQKEERGEFHEDWMLPNGTIDERLQRLHKKVMR